MHLCCSKRRFLPFTDPPVVMGCSSHRPGGYPPPKRPHSSCYSTSKIFRITGVDAPRSVGLLGSAKKFPHGAALWDGTVAQNPLFLGLFIDGVGGGNISDGPPSKGATASASDASRRYAVRAGGAGGVREGIGGSKSLDGTDRRAHRGDGDGFR